MDASTAPDKDLQGKIAEALKEVSPGYAAAFQKRAAAFDACIEDEKTARQNDPVLFATSTQDSCLMIALPPANTGSTPAEQKLEQLELIRRGDARIRPKAEGKN